MAYRVRNVKMRHRAKFRGNRSKHDRDIVIFRISRWQTPAILDFKKFIILMVDRSMRVNMHHHAKFCSNQSNRCRNRAMFLIFKMAAVRHLRFLNFEIINGRHVHGGQYVPQHQFL